MKLDAIHAATTAAAAGGTGGAVGAGLFASPEVGAAIAVAVSAFGGIAAQLRHPDPLEWRRALGEVGVSVVAGFVFWAFADMVVQDQFKRIAIAGVAGVAGVAALNLAVRAVSKRYGLHVGDLFPTRDSLAKPPAEESDE